MFEAVVTLCLLAAPDICRDVLTPGREAATAADCAARLAAAPPDLARHSGLTPAPGGAGAPRCAPAGPAAAVVEAAPGVFVHLGHIDEPTAHNHGDVANAGFVIGERSVAVIDAGGSRQAGEALFRAIRARTALPISHVALTHMHPDHVLGASVFVEAGAMVIGHAKLDRALSDRGRTYLTNFSALMGAGALLGSRIVATDLAVEDAVAIDIGGRTLSIRAWPRAHSGTDLTVLDEATGALFAGDLLFDDHAPALDGSALGWMKVLKEMRALPATQVVPGHGGPVLPWPEGAAALERYLSVLIADARAAIARGDSLMDAAETIGAGEASLWRMFELYNPRNATVAFTEFEWE